MRYLIVLSALVLALAASATATAGGWATVKLASLPTGLDSGDTWNAQITVLRHGVTPTDGATPSVSIHNAATGETAFYGAEPTGTTGVYEAAVVFPGAGTWSYEVDDGLVSTGYGESTTSTYAPVDVRPAAGGGDSDPFPVLPALGVVGAVVLLAAAALAVLRQRRLTPAS